MKQGIKSYALTVLNTFGLLFLGLLFTTYVKSGADLDFKNQDIALFLAAFTTAVLFITYLYLRNWKYIIMPYSLKLLTNTKGEEKDTSVYLDRFMWYDRTSNILYYRNRNAIDVQSYHKSKQEILHYLGLLNKSCELHIEPFLRKWVKIKIYKLPESYPFDKGAMRQNKIYYGRCKDGNFYVDLDKQTTMLATGLSGSGKSTFMNCLINSLILNEDKLDHLYLVDLKGVELKQFEGRKRTFIDSIDNVASTFKELKQLMYNRYKVMQEFGHKTFAGDPIYVVIDEVGTIGTHYDKKLKEAIFNDMIELFQKGRACKIIFLLFAQKCDSQNIPSNVLTNIQSHVLMKTDSEFNTNAMIGTKEQIQEITITPVSSFIRGRLIYKDGLTSDCTLIQAPLLK